MRINDGTYALVHGELTRVYPTEGYIVARVGEETVIRADNDYLERIMEDYRLRAIRLAGFVGIWTNPSDGHTYFDIVDVYPDYNIALATSRANGQICFWDNVNSEPIPSTAPFRATHRGHTGISSLSYDSAMGIAKGSYAKATQTLLEVK